MSKSTGNNQRFVSVVVCSYNGAGHLAATLKALKEQTYPRKLYEVIVIDDGSTDNTAQIARDSGFNVISQPKNQGLGISRNTGMNAASGEILAYTDDDCLPAASWVEEIARPYIDQTVMAVGGRTFAVIRQTPTERYMDEIGYGNPAPFGISGGHSPLARLKTYLSQMVHPLHSSLHNSQPLQEIFTLNASYRLDRLRQIGGFDETLRAAEDSDVSARLYERFPECRIVFAEAARVGHRHRRQYWPWVIQTFGRSQDGFVQIRKEHRIPPLYPFPIVCIALGLLGCIAGPLIGLLVLGLSPLGLYWWWQIRVKSPFADRLRFPYMQAILEGAILFGYAIAFVTFRAATRDR